MASDKVRLEQLNKKIIKCRKCPRLSEYIRMVAKEKVSRFMHEKYWGRPLPGFGDVSAQLLIIGLAPAAHGGNRTGRMFTGDGSGEWLAKALYENKFATKNTSEKLGDGFELKNAYVTAAIRCAPPKNKPTRMEIENCMPYISDELKILKNIRVIICLGRIAFETFCKLFSIKGKQFGHGKSFCFSGMTIICSYHPSRQNTQTGRLSWDEWTYIFQKANQLLRKSYN